MQLARPIGKDTVLIDRNKVEDLGPIVTANDRLVRTLKFVLNRPKYADGYNFAMALGRLEGTLDCLRQATIATQWENNLWLVGGYVRDKLLGIESNSDDVDIVLETDSAELTEFLDRAGLSDHTPVIYPRFGTAMISLDGVNIEFVTARSESYEQGSRKPQSVTKVSIEEDARRRDFTINTLLENLHTGVTSDPLGNGLADLKLGIIRTPLPPRDTFADDPLRMLRAIRFASRFDFFIEESAWDAIGTHAPLLVKTVSGERIRDEFNKILMARKPSSGLTLLLESGLLAQFAPELAIMYGVTQNAFHCYDVWQHTLVALDNLVEREESSPLLLRLAVLMHDCGKPETRSVGTDGRVHFYAHQDVGARIARTLLDRLKFSHSDIQTVSSLVAQHMRIGEYKPDEWSDSAVRRFIRSSAEHLEWLFAIHRADVSALDAEYHDISRAVQLRERIEHLESVVDSRKMESPLSGSEIMQLTGINAGPQIGELKAALTDAVIDGRIAQFDKQEAGNLVLELLKKPD